MAAPILQEYSLFLRLLSMRVTTARLSSGVRVIDASDFRMWLSGFFLSYDEIDLSLRFRRGRKSVLVDWEQKMEQEWGPTFVHESGHAPLAVLCDIPLLRYLF